MKVLALLAVLLLAFSVATATEVQACETCKFLVGLIQSEVKGKETQITDAFKKAVCSRLGELEAPCTAFVDAYGKQAVDFIVQKLDADEVCHKLSLCDNAEWVKKIFTEQSAAKLIKFALEQESNNQLCDMCQFVVNEAEQYLNKSEPDVEKALVKACGMLPPQLTGICDMIVLTYGHQIIQYIIKYENATIVCQQLGLCSKKDAPVQIPEAIVKGTAGQCELCKFLVTTVENYLKDNATEAKIQSQLESLCKFTGSYSEQCIQIVDEYLPYIIYYVTENYDADKICQLVGICTKKAEATFEKAEALPTCAICQWVVTEIEHLVSKEITEKKVQDALGKVCDIVPNTFRGACIDLVNTYAPIIIQKVLEKATPAQVCAAVKACKTEVKVEEPKPMKAQDGLCELCKQVTNYLENLIQSNATSAQIIAALTKVCDVVPSQFKAQCQVAIPLVWQTLVKKLLDKETPEQVCKQVHFCPATAEVEVKPVEKVQPTFIPEDENNMVCDGCKQLVAIANNFITKNSTEQQIITYIEQACDFFPDSYKGLCKVVVEQYGPALLEKLAQQVLQPDTVCKAVKACPTKMDPALKRVLMAQPVQRIRLN